MANDFSSDSRFKALWLFENGALTTDSKGTNTLTAVNTPTADTSDFREGAACTVLTATSHQFYKIADASLDAGFPLKSGDAVKKMTVCGWFKLSSTSGYQQLWGKGGKYSGAGNVAFCLFHVNGSLRFKWGTAPTTGIEPIALVPLSNLAINIWYHISVVIDGVNKFCYIRVFKASDSSIQEFFVTPDLGSGYGLNTALYVGAEEFRIGAYVDQDANYTLAGRVDELVVAADCLTIAELEAIRAGTFSGTGIQTAIGGAGLQITGTEEAQIGMSGLQMIYGGIPDYGIGMAGLVVVYSELPPYHRIFPVPPANRVQQSQTGKRQFPVVI